MAAEQQKTEKKRTVYKQGSLLDFPKNLDTANYGFKWRSAEQLAGMSDGYDPKGWELYKDKDGKYVKRGDVILAQMPIDMYRAMKDGKKEAADNQTKLLFEEQASQLDRETHEFRKKGGKIKFEFKQE